MRKKKRYQPGTGIEPPLFPSSIIGYTLAMNLLIFAQAGAEPVSDPSLLMWYMTACGPFFGPLFVLLSIVFVTLAIMNWLAVSRNAIIPPEMIEQFREKWEAKEYQDAYDIAQKSDSSLGKIWAAGLVELSKNTDTVEQVMHDTAEEEIMVLEHRLGYLGTIASVSPMIGLLGTVWGMVDAFSVIAKTGAPQASELAKGISLALVTTQIGLLIAIPAMVLFEILKTRLARLVLELSFQLENALKQFKQN